MPRSGTWRLVIPRIRATLQTRRRNAGLCWKSGTMVLRRTKRANSWPWRVTFDGSSQRVFRRPRATRKTASPTPRADGPGHDGPVDRTAIFTAMGVYNGGQRQTSNADYRGIFGLPRQLWTSIVRLKTIGKNEVKGPNPLVGSSSSPEVTAFTRWPRGFTFVAFSRTALEERQIQAPKNRRGVTGGIVRRYRVEFVGGHRDSIGYHSAHGGRDDHGDRGVGAGR